MTFSKYTELWRHFQTPILERSHHLQKKLHASLATTPYSYLHPR
jgi:hypothetical protein